MVSVLDLGLSAVLLSGNKPSGVVVAIHQWFIHLQAGSRTKKGRWVGAHLPFLVREPTLLVGYDTFTFILYVTDQNLLRSFHL